MSLADAAPLSFRLAGWSPKGADGVALRDQQIHRHGARPSPCPPANGLVSGNDGLGAPSLRPSAPLTDPANRMVEPKSWGRSHSLVWAQPFAHLPRHSVSTALGSSNN